MHPVYALVAFAGTSATLAAAAPLGVAKLIERSPARGTEAGTTETSLVVKERTNKAKELVFQRRVPARFRSMEERRQFRREEAKKKQQHKQKKKHDKGKKGKKAESEESGDDDPDSGDIDESGQYDDTDESGNGKQLSDDTNSGDDTNSSDTDDDDGPA